VYDRRRTGECVFLVETNGDLYQTDERGRPELRLGNVTTDTIDQILASDAYEASVRRTEAKAARFCGGCRHYGFCNGYPVHAEPFVTAPPEGCPVTSAVHDHIERHLLATGYNPEHLAHLLRAPVPATVVPASAIPASASPPSAVPARTVPAHTA
jgi:radical SAM protein with 4Fe4S-binding SPASM domain